MYIVLTFPNDVLQYQQFLYSKTKYNTLGFRYISLTLGILKVVWVCDGMSDIVIISLRVFSFDYCSFQQGLVYGENQG